MLGRIQDVIYDGPKNDSHGFTILMYWIPAGRPGGTASGAGPGGQPNASTPPEELLNPNQKLAVKDPAEAIGLYQLIRDKLAVEPGKEGEEIVKFARFLERNKDKIEGILQANKKSGKSITEAEIQKIIALYGKFIATADQETPETLDKPGDFDKAFQYDPNWAKMSKEDRKLLIDYSKMNPEEIEKGKVDFSRLTQDIKEEMALKLVDSWPGAVLEAAQAAFTDAGFVISLILTIAIYIGLWLTPDPSFVTKVAAGTLTAVMWAMFAWEDIWNTMVEYSAFTESVKRARTAAELKAAGNRMAKKIGAVGFDILMMIATWGLGKAAGPKLRAAGAKRGVARAETAVGAAAADPAAGVPKPAEGPARTLLNDAKSSAKGSTATAVLDALEPRLDATAKEGLKTLRSSGAGDIGTYRALESEAGRGIDLDHFLSQKAATPQARAQARANLLKAEALLARAKLIEAETIGDPKLRKAARSAQLKSLVETLKARLQQLGLYEDARVRRGVEDHNLKDLVSALGEALQRTQLEPELTGKSRVVSNLAVLKEVPGYKTVAEWQRATGASSRDAAKMFQGDGKIYESLGEIDAMIVEDMPVGKPEVKLIEEVKSGASDTQTDALAQVTKKVLPALEKVAEGDGTIRVFELKGKKQLGADRTGAYDFSGNIQARTRGPAGKGFQESLPYDPEVLEQTAQDLIDQGLPTKGPQKIPPVTGLKPRDTDETK